MGIKSRIKNAIDALAGKEPDSYPVASHELGESGRESRIEPLTRNFGRAIIRPKEVRQSASFQVTYKNMMGMTISEMIRHLIFRSPEMKSIVLIYQNFLIQDYELVSEDENAIEIIEQFIKRMGGKAKFLSILRQGAYGMKVEGGSCFELSNDDQGMAEKIDWVSPWTLAAQKMEGDRGEYWVYGQQSLYGKLEPILYDESDKDNYKYFTYIPVGQEGNEPFGTSSLSSIANSVVALNNLITLMVQYIQGRVFPKKMFAIDVKTLSDLGYDKKQIENIAIKMQALLKGKLDASDITQDELLTVPIVATLISGLERSGIDGSELMGDMFERQAQRGSMTPRTLFGSRRTGSGLNDNESRIEWGAWDITIESDSVLITDPITEFFSIVLEQQGNQSGCQLKLINNDVEINRIHAEYFELKAQAFTTIKALGIYTQEELRKKFSDSTKTSFNFSDLGPELPDELMALPTPNEPEEPEDSEGDE